MDWKIALSTFAAVFLAELGDKTQLATFTLAAGANSKMSVLIGAALSLYVLAFYTYSANERKRPRPSLFS